MVFPWRVSPPRTTDVDPVALELARRLVVDTLGDVSTSYHGHARRHADQQQPRTHGGACRVLGSLFLVMVVARLRSATGEGPRGTIVARGQSVGSRCENQDLVTVRQPPHRVGDAVSNTNPQGHDGAGGQAIHRIITVDTRSVEPAFTTQGDHHSPVVPWSLGSLVVVREATRRVLRMGVASSGSKGFPVTSLAVVKPLVLRPRTSMAHTGRPVRSSPDITN